MRPLAASRRPRDCCFEKLPIPCRLNNCNHCRRSACSGAETMKLCVNAASRERARCSRNWPTCRHWVREVGQPLIREATRLDRTSGIAAIGRNIGMMWAKKRSPWPMKIGPWIGSKNLVELQDSRCCKEALPWQVGERLDVHHHRNLHFGGDVVHAAHLGRVERHMILHLADADGPAIRTHCAGRCQHPKRVGSVLTDRAN